MNNANTKQRILKALLPTLDKVAEALDGTDMDKRMYETQHMFKMMEDMSSGDKPSTDLAVEMILYDLGTQLLAKDKE
jgi:hypothetical protein